MWWGSEEVGVVGSEVVGEGYQLAILCEGCDSFRRWEVIATFVNTHSSKDCKEKTSQQAISKFKMLKKLGQLCGCN